MWLFDLCNSEIVRQRTPHVHPARWCGAADHGASALEDGDRGGATGTRGRGALHDLRRRLRRVAERADGLQGRTGAGQSHDAPLRVRRRGRAAPRACGGGAACRAAEFRSSGAAEDPGSSSCSVRGRRIGMRVSNRRAGGFVGDGVDPRGGQVESVELESLAGGECRIRSPWLGANCSACRRARENSASW